MSPPWTAWIRTNLFVSGPGSSERAASTQAEVARLVGVVAALREHCPWTAALTHESLTGYVLEEAHELIDAIETGHGSDISAELGDLLLQVVLHARLGQESGSFDFAAVANGLSQKLIRRSPHVFYADGSLRESFPATLAEIEATWERVKAGERAALLTTQPSTSQPSTSQPGTTENTGAGPHTLFASIPTTLPALAAAQKSIERAQRAGLKPAAAGQEGARYSGTLMETEEALGKVLFDVVLEAQRHGLDAERALRHAVRNFQVSGESA